MARSKAVTIEEFAKSKGQSSHDFYAFQMLAAGALGATTVLVVAAAFLSVLL